MRRPFAAAMLALVVLAWPAHAQLFPPNPFSDTPPTPTTEGATPDFTPFLGGWGGHGRGMTVQRDGSAEYIYRIYRWCAPSIKPPCDSLEGNIIKSGGRAIFKFWKAEGGTLSGTIEEATEPLAFPPGGSIRLELREYGTAELLSGDEEAGSGMLLCGARFAEAPEAFRATYPCGA